MFRAIDAAVYLVSGTTNQLLDTMHLSQFDLLRLCQQERKFQMPHLGSKSCKHTIFF